MATGFQTRHQKTLAENRPTTIQTSSATYETMEYPKGLGTERYPHFTLFYINANSRSKLDTGKEVVFADGVTQESVITENTAGLALSKSTVGKITSPSKRLNYAICLPMPTRIQGNYSAKYTETAPAGMLGAGLSALFEGHPLEALGAVVQSALSSGEMTKMLGSLAKDAGYDQLGRGLQERAKSQGEMFAKGVGAVMNKRQEQLFESINFRDHTMQWLFLPRSKEESDVIFNICKTFKSHMHPELDPLMGSSSLLMPSEFDVEFRYGDSQNQKIHKIATSVLEGVAIDYTAIGEFITFDGYDDPVAIQLSLRFKEMEPLHRGMIEGGF